jgi:tRNA pseudouridine38-40 synthase
MSRFKITVAYDGSDYAGWQVQPNRMTVQQRIEDTLLQLTGERIKVHGSGRTDRGVHARMQVAHFDLERGMDATSVLNGMNALLPDSIRILRINGVKDTFHARRSAVSKQYRYFIWNGEIMPPVLRKYRTHARRKLDVEAMRSAASQLVGKHDFAAFTANPNREVNGPVRTLKQLRVLKRGPEIVIIAESDGFLFKMVRSLAGFLIRVGEGALPPSEATAILHSVRRTARVPTAPPQGLFLWRVDY